MTEAEGEEGGTYTLWGTQQSKRLLESEASLWCNRGPLSYPSALHSLPHRMHNTMDFEENENIRLRFFFFFGGGGGGGGG